MKTSFGIRDEKSKKPKNRRQKKLRIVLDDVLSFTREQKTSKILLNAP